MRTTRKCDICKNPINIQDNSEDFFIIKKEKNNKYYHTKCYIDKETTKKKNKKTYEECIEYINKCRLNSQNILHQQMLKDQLNDFVFDMYDVSFIPNYFYVKLESIFQGTYKGLKKPIPVEDLLDMWQQKKDYLNKLATKNKKKGKEIDGITRIYYDLSILLSKHDAYLQWKEKQKEVSDSNNTNNNITSIDYSDIKRPINSNKKQNIDILDMLDEI